MPLSVLILIVSFGNGFWKDGRRGKGKGMAKLKVAEPVDEKDAPPVRPGVEIVVATPLDEVDKFKRAEDGVNGKDNAANVAEGITRPGNCGVNNAGESISDDDSWNYDS